MTDPEWEGELHEPYIRGIQKYYRNERLQQYSIKTIIGKTLDNYYSNFCRNLKRKKRNPLGGMCEYYDGIEEDIQSAGIIGSVDKVIDNSVEREVLSKLMVESIYHGIEDEKERNILKLILIGDNKGEIERLLCLSRYTRIKKTSEIRKIIMDIYKEN